MDRRKTEQLAEVYEPLVKLLLASGSEVYTNIAKVEMGRVRRSRRIAHASANIQSFPFGFAYLLNGRASEGYFTVIHSPSRLPFSSSRRGDNV